VILLGCSNENKRYHISLITTQSDTLTLLKSDMKPLNGIVYELNNDGKFKYELNYKNGSLDGVQKTYFDKYGRSYYEDIYENNILISSKYFHKNQLFDLSQCDCEKYYGNIYREIYCDECPESQDFLRKACIKKYINPDFNFDDNKSWEYGYYPNTDTCKINSLRDQRYNININIMSLSLCDECESSSTDLVNSIDYGPIKAFIKVDRQNEISAWKEAFRLSQTDEDPYFVKDTIWEGWELIMNGEKTFSWELNKDRIIVKTDENDYLVGILVYLIDFYKVREDDDELRRIKKQFLENKRKQKIQQDLKERNGTYSLKSADQEFHISIKGNKWYGSYKLCQYCETEKSKGSIRDKKLYSKSGFVEMEIGYIDDNSITTSLGGKNITLIK
ncbi:hypothetical protein N9V65_05025, partial [Flavobacteriales bacterium]|nr:hypothetical protein [Flavobacteriales bacterium]